MAAEGLQAIALMGPTGAGKSTLAMRIAEEQGVSIISCDSMQVYCGLDIGTAKPTSEEQQQVRHELIDCVYLPNICSAASWATRAREVIRAENQQGRRSLICGGTGLYLRALLQGFSPIPEENEAVRKQFEALQHEHGAPYLHRLLAEVDPALASTLAEHDTQRIMRGLCVYHSHGTPLSSYQAQACHAEPIACPVFVLNVERQILRDRIQIRFMQMIEQGWLQEVQWLYAQQLDDTHPARRAVGYRQLYQTLETEDNTPLQSMDKAIERGIIATRQYAKRQNTWFRNQHPDAISGDTNDLYACISKEYQRNG